MWNSQNTFLFSFLFFFFRHLGQQNMIWQLFIVSPFLTEGKTAIFSKSEPLPIDRREKTSDHKPPEPRSRVACHPVTHLNLKTAAFSFIFCHFVATVFRLMRPLTINFCFVNAAQKLDPSQVGDVDVVPLYSSELSPRWQTKEKHFIQKLKGSIKWRRGI